MNTIRGRLIVALLAGCLAVLGIAGWLIYVLARDVLLAGVDARLRVEALAIVQQTYQSFEEDRREEGRGKRKLDVFFADRFLPEFQEGGTEFYQVWRPDGDTDDRSDSLGDHDLPRRTGTLEAPLFWSLTSPNGERARAVGIEFVPSSWGRQRRFHDDNYRASVVVAGELGPVAVTLRQLRTVLLGVGGVASMTIFLAVPWIVWKGFRPLKRLSDDASKVNADRLNFRFNPEGLPGELAPIAGRLNELFGRLESSFERERRFSADAAHELRTPLAELRSLAEVSLKWPPSPEEARQVFRETLEVAIRMEALVSGLLAIARSRADDRPVVLETVVLSELLRNVAARHAPLLDRREIELVVQAPEDLQVRLNVALADSVFANLIGNAAEYATAGGRVEVAVNAAEGFVAVTIANPVEGLEAGDVSRLFDRFWRKDSNRTDVRHSGLGLAVARASADALGWEIDARLSEPRRLCITVGRIPMA